VIDLSVTNRLPRVRELIVVAANLMHDSLLPLPDRARHIADLDHELNPLTPGEHAAVRALAPAAAAMELLGALAAWHLDRDQRDETAYLMEVGMAGLRDFFT
jgi:hypothetical protein